jgi:hypothetical protein
MIDYLCRKKCVFKGRLYKEGMRVFFDEGEKVPKYFVPAGKDAGLRTEDDAPPEPVKKRSVKKSGK